MSAAAKNSFNVSKTNKFSVLDAPGISTNTTATKQKQVKKQEPSSKTATSGSTIKSTVDPSSSPSVDIEQLILTYLSTHDDIPDSWHFSVEIKQDHQSVVGAIKALLPDAYIKEELLTTSYYALTQEGTDILTNGSPEYQVFKAISASTATTVADIQSQLGDIGKIGLGKCLQNKWVKKEGELLVKIKEDVVDEVIAVLSLIQSSSSSSNGNGGELKEDEELKNLKKRKLVQQITRKSYRLFKGPAYQPVRVKRMAELTKEMLGNPAEVSSLTN